MLKAMSISPDDISYTSDGGIAMQSYDSRRYTAPPRVMPDSELYRLLKSSVYLQIILTHFLHSENYSELIPAGLFAQEQQGLLCLCNLFRQVEVRTRKGGLYYYYVAEAYSHVLDLLRQLAHSGQADPLLCHFSYNREGSPLTDGERVFYELLTDRPMPAGEIEKFRKQPFVDCCLSQWGAMRNSPGIQLSGWGIEQLCADAYTQMLACCVNNLYLNVFPLPGGGQGMQLRWYISNPKPPHCVPL